MSKLFKNVYLALLLSGLVASDPTTTCNPLSASCSLEPALATSYSEEFETNSTYFETYRSGENVHYTDEGLKLTLGKQFDNPSIVSKEYMLFGRVEVLVKAANGTGVISTVYLQSEVLDEIDWEWFGGDASQVATDYFHQGNTATYDRGTYYDMADPRTDYHNYTLDWTESEIVWYVDGQVARTLSNTTDQGYPQTPCRIFIGLWAGGDPSNAEGTIEWAGGYTDYSQAPFEMYVKGLKVSDYSTGRSYSYLDQTGDLDSIEVVDGLVNGRYDQAIELESTISSSAYSISSGSPTSAIETKSVNSASITSHSISAFHSIAAVEFTSAGSTFLTISTSSLSNSTSAIIISTGGSPERNIKYWLALLAIPLMLF